MSRNVRWNRITSHHLSSQIAGRKVDLRYEFAGFLSGWKILVDGIQRGMERELDESMIMASSLVHQGPVEAEWLSEVEIAA